MRRSARSRISPTCRVISNSGRGWCSSERRQKTEVRSQKRSSVGYILVSVRATEVECGRANLFDRSGEHLTPGLGTLGANSSIERVHWFRQTDRFDLRRG